MKAAEKRKYAQFCRGKLINQMIFYGGQGVFFDKDTRLHISADKSFVIHPEFVNDFENEDYNNAFYNVTVIEEE